MASTDKAIMTEGQLSTLMTRVKGAIAGNPETISAEDWSALWT